MDYWPIVPTARPACGIHHNISAHHISKQVVQHFYYKHKKIKIVWFLTSQKVIFMSKLRKRLILDQFCMRNPKMNGVKCFGLRKGVKFKMACKIASIS